MYGRPETKLGEIFDKIPAAVNESIFKEVAGHNQKQLPEMLADFLPVAMKELKLDKLPHIKLLKYVPDDNQPTFGKFVNHENKIYLGIANRHPIDILRTLAHELVHFKQNVEHKLGPESGTTGSPEENEAHQVAGIIMRHYDKMYPEAFHTEPLEFDV